jgi:hypothetical protein
MGEIAGKNGTPSPNIRGLLLTTLKMLHGEVFFDI